jgi:5-formyltetrahydrofolate cyclo-ligase
MTVLAMRAAKVELRRTMRERRVALPAADAARLAARAAVHLAALPALAAARVVALYAPVRGEIDTAPIAQALRARGLMLCYPRVVPAHRHLHFHAVADERALCPSPGLGIPEPPADLPRVAAHEIDLFVVPGLAFDRAGERLGWGRGYYDTTLAAAPEAFRVGYAYDFQLVPAVPVSADDERVDVLVTETGAHVTAARPTQTLRRAR